MATLERRVQVLFDEQLYAEMLEEAEAERMSVGALIRDAVEQRLARRRMTAQEALQRLFARADEYPPVYGPELNWAQEKEALLDRPILRDIS